MEGPLHNSSGLYPMPDENKIVQVYSQSIGLAWMASSLNGIIIKTNEEFCSRLGYSEEELIGKSILDIVHYKEKKDLENFFSACSVVEKNAQKRFIKKDGTVQSLNYKTVAVDDKINAPYRVWYVSNWETLNQAISELQKDKLLLKVLLENTTDIIYFKDLNSRFLVISDSKFKKSHVEHSDDVLGKTDFDFFTEEHARQAYNDEQEIIRTGKPIIGIEEKEVWLKTGKVTWASTSKMPYYDEEGKIIGTFGISRDITEKKKIENEINEKSKILNGIVNNLPVIIFKIDEAGDFVMLQGNKKRIEHFKKSRTAKLSIKDTLKLARKKLQQINFNEDYFSFTSNYSSNHSEWHFENFMFKEQYDESSFAGFSIDISDRKNDEQELKRHTKNLQKINKELDQFAYVVSHDLKAPLRAINNLSEWIEEDMGDDVGSDIKKNFGLLRGRVRRMQSLIDGILEYSRIGRMHVQTEKVDTDKMVTDLLENLGIPNNFTIIKPSILPVITVNKLRLEQVFMNLISNAIKYHDKEKGIVIIDYEKQDHFHVFSVSDDGPGIAAEFHEKVFQIFQTLQPRDSVESTGVGLSIVKKIIEEQGGKVWIESEPGKGAKFIFTIPE